MKAVGTIIVMLLLFLPKPIGVWRFALLLILIVQGPLMTYKVKKHQQFTPYLPSATIDRAVLDSAGTMTARLTDFEARIEVLDDVTNCPRSDYRGLWSAFHRGTGPTVRVRVTNTSEAVWEPSPVTGMHAVNLCYQWLDADTKRLVLDGKRYPLGAQVPPGASCEFELQLIYPRPGRYILHVSMIQEGHAFFYHLCDQYSRELIVE
jgi:hypothetical protein